MLWPWMMRTKFIIIKTQGRRGTKPGRSGMRSSKGGSTPAEEVGRQHGCRQQRPRGGGGEEARRQVKPAGADKGELEAAGEGVKGGRRPGNAPVHSQKIAKRVREKEEGGRGAKGGGGEHGEVVEKDTRDALKGRGPAPIRRRKPARWRARALLRQLGGDELGEVREEGEPEAAGNKVGVGARVKSVSRGVANSTGRHGTSAQGAVGRREDAGIDLVPEGVGQEGGSEDTKGKFTKKGGVRGGGDDTGRRREPEVRAGEGAGGRHWN